MEKYRIRLSNVLETESRYVDVARLFNSALGDFRASTVAGNLDRLTLIVLLLKLRFALRELVSLNITLRRILNRCVDFDLRVRKTSFLSKLYICNLISY